jgi:hypothetical protein
VDIGQRLPSEPVHSRKNDISPFLLRLSEMVDPVYVQAVATRNLPLCCVVCQCKILRVKNNYRPLPSSSSSSCLPKSVSGYEMAAGGGGGGRLRHSDSSYSVSSYGSGRSTASARSAASAAGSWFSIDSLSSFQCVSFDRNLPQPRVSTWMCCPVGGGG